MNSDSRKKNIPDLFLHTSKKDWAEVAKKELAGADPFETLKMLKEGMTILPYYDSSDVPDTPFQLSASTNSYSGNRSWGNLSIVHTTHPDTANKKALLALQSGADGVLFALDGHSFSEVLLKNIQWEHCSLHFFATEDQVDFFTSLIAFAGRQNFNPKELTGSVFWKTVPDNLITLTDVFRDYEKFHCLGICLNDNSRKAIAIATALSQAVHCIDTLTNKNIPLAWATQQVAFSVPIGTDFFLEIATLKVMRRLWYQVVKAYDTHAIPTLHIHAHSTAFTKSQFQSNANLIKSSTAALAAIAGGCDSLSIETEDDKNTTLSRMARNVSSILLEESHLGLVADPTAGSYYLENLTNELARNAWALFQEMTIS